MTTRKKYNGVKQASRGFDNQGRKIPDHLELNLDLGEHTDPIETKEDALPYYRLKNYLKYKIK